MRANKTTFIMISKHFAREICEKPVGFVSRVWFDLHLLPASNCLQYNCNVLLSEGKQVTQVEVFDITLHLIAAIILSNLHLFFGLDRDCLA